MPVKSVIDIEVNDADFKRFVGVFEKYQGEVNASPGVWNRVADAADKAAHASVAMGAAVGAAFTGLRNIGAEHETVTRHTKAQAGFWSSIATSADKFTRRVYDATRSLLRWGELTGLISGILGAGGLFGIDRLAVAAGNQRQRSLTLGSKPGEAAAFDTNFSRVVDTGAFLSNVNKGLNEVTSDQFLGMRYAGAHTEGMTDAVEAGVKAFRALGDLVDRVPLGPMFNNTMENTGAASLMSLDELKKLKATPKEEREEYIKDFLKDQERFAPHAGALKAFQDLAVQFDRAGKAIKTDFINALEPLAPNLKLLSKDLTQLIHDIMSNPHIKEWIDKLAEAINWLDVEISKPEFKQHVTDFINYIGELPAKVLAFTGGVNDLVADFNAVKTFLDDQYKETIHDFREMMGSLETAAKVFTDALDTVLGPWIKGRGPSASEAERWNREHPDQMMKVPDEPGEEPRDWGKPWTWFHHSHEIMPPTAVQKERFDRLEGAENLPPGILNADMQVESSGNFAAVSPAGAKGPFQFMDATAAEFGVQDPFDFEQASKGMARKLHSLIQEYHGDLEKALAANNWGQKHLNEDIAYAAKTGTDWRDYLPNETKHYVEKVMSGVEKAQTSKQMPGVKPVAVNISVNNATGGNSFISGSQIAVG